MQSYGLDPKLWALGLRAKDPKTEWKQRIFVRETNKCLHFFNSDPYFLGSLGGQWPAIVKSGRPLSTSSDQSTSNQTRNNTTSTSTILKHEYNIIIIETTYSNKKNSGTYRNHGNARPMKPNPLSPSKNGKKSCQLLLRHHFPGSASSAGQPWMGEVAYGHGTKPSMSSKMETIFSERNHTFFTKQIGCIDDLDNLRPSNNSFLVKCTISCKRYKVSHLYECQRMSKTSKTHLRNHERLSLAPVYIVHW